VELPQINALGASLAEEGGLVIGINYKEPLGTVQYYQNLYPNILMLCDYSGGVYSRYRQNGYIPLNYVIDHDLDQTIDYWMEGYNHSVITGKMNALLPDVSVVLDPDSYTYNRGGSLGFDATLYNWTGSNQSLYLLIDVELPSGSYYEVSTESINLSPNQTKVIAYDLNIPGAAPLGDYRMRVRLGTPPANLWNADFFNFEMVP